MDRELLAARLETARKRAGLSRFDLAEMIDVTPSAIAGYELRRYTPSPETLKLLAEALNVSADWLTGGTQ